MCALCNLESIAKGAAQSARSAQSHALLRSLARYPRSEHAVDSLPFNAACFCADGVAHFPSSRKLSNCTELSDVCISSSAPVVVMLEVSFNSVCSCQVAFTSCGESEGGALQEPRAYLINPFTPQKRWPMICGPWVASSY